MKATRRRGFTLFELLVVVAVVSLLVAILTGGICCARSIDRIDKTRALLSRISTALQSYQEQFLAYPPSDRPLQSAAANLHWYLVAPHPAKSPCICENTGYGYEEVGPFLSNLDDREVANGHANPWVPGSDATALASEIIDPRGTRLGYYCVDQGAGTYGGTDHRSQKHADWCDHRASFDLWSRGPDTSLPPPSAFGPPSPTVGENREITNWTPR